jgi:hypothetical protein
MDAASFRRLQQELPQYAENAKLSYDGALKSGIENLYLKKSVDQNFNFDKAMQNLQEEYQRNINEIDKRVFDFQIEAVAKVFSGEEGEILPDLSGTLEERLGAAVAGALEANPKAESWTPEQWAEMLGLENNSELAAQLQEVLTPATAGMTSGFLEDFKMQSGLTATDAYNAFKTDMETVFSKPIEVRPAVTVVKYPPASFTAQAPSPVPVPYALSSGRNRFGIPAPIPEFSYAASSEQNPLVPYNAAGGYFTQAELGVYGEDGPEFIIPVSSKHRERGTELWERAGDMLGVSAGSGAAGGNAPISIPITVQNSPTLEVTIDGGADDGRIARVIKGALDSPDITDSIAHKLALSLQQVFANIPKEAQVAY